jgi:hypothetical protein
LGRTVHVIPENTSVFATHGDAIARLATPASAAASHLPDTRSITCSL